MLGWPAVAGCFNLYPELKALLVILNLDFFGLVLASLDHLVQHKARSVIRELKANLLVERVRMVTVCLFALS